MENIDINLATEEERDWAAKLLSESDPWITLGINYERCSKACHDYDYLMYISHIENKPCGVIILHRKGAVGSPYIKTIAVSAEFRSSGVGKALIDFSENLFRNEAKHIFLCVSSFNKRAQSFYVRLGYEKVGELKDYIINGESEILMHKKL